MDKALSKMCRITYYCKSKYYNLFCNSVDDYIYYTFYINYCKAF